MIALELDLRQGHSHRVDVCLRFTPRQHRLVLALPRWTPGSYLLREYVGHLEGLVVHQGGVPLTARRTTPFVWQLELSELAPLTISYTIQAAELSVRTAHLTDEHGFLPLAAVVLAIEGERWTPHQLKLVMPDHWQGFVPLPQQTDGTWLASDLDQLIDSPVEAGPHAVHGFSVAGVPHRWVTWGDDLPGHDAHWLADVEAVCLTCCRLLAEPQPAASSYLFVLHLTEQGYGVAGEVGRVAGAGTQHVRRVLPVAGVGGFRGRPGAGGEGVRRGVQDSGFKFEGRLPLQTGAS